MTNFLNQLLEAFEKNMTKTYLVLANIVLAVFAIWFSNAGLLPFKNVGDFAFFAILALILGLYRPGWTFVFFVGALALENINLVPVSFGISIRPYQFFGSITIIALLVQMISKRLAFSLPKLRWPDFLVLVFALAGFVSSFASANFALSFKQSVVAFSFACLYFLVRVYVQSFADLKRTLPFFLSTGVVVMIYSIWQNIAFLRGATSFEIMPGRPNATFAEADWLGMYVIFLLATLFSMLYVLHKNSANNYAAQIFNFQFSPQWDKLEAKIFNKFFNDLIFKQIGIYFLLIMSFVVLILTVSRSAWVGAFFVTAVFLKFILLGWYGESAAEVGSKWRRFFSMFNLGRWQWKNAGIQLLFILMSLGIGVLISIPLTRFEIASRAVSTGGLQKITVACEIGKSAPEKIENIEQLAGFGCRHINLEEIDSEKNAGNIISEVYRPDPNVNIRSEIYKKSWAQIKSHPILGLGWGQISSVLGKDSRGAGLNASNIFLEVWLGSGLLGFLSFVILLGYIVFASVGAFMKNAGKSEKMNAIVFVMLGLAAIVFPNLFNSGIFLGFVWVYLGVAVSLLSEKIK